MSVTQTADPKRAVDFYDRACDRQNGRACHNLGVLIMHGGLGANLAELLRTRLREKADLGQTMRLFRQSCDGDIAMTCSRLAEAYVLGDGVAIDPQRAAAFRRGACDLGRQSACAGPRP